jgi:SNF2 family DNA or RNA helicase
MSRLWTHQHEAVAFAAARPAAMWHMGMGTGKSRCAIELAKRVEAKRVLVLCPLSVCAAWSEQLARFGSGFIDINLGKGGVKAKTTKAKQALARAAALNEPCFVVVNYESARNAPLSQLLEKQGFDLLVLDESHRIKSPSGATSRWVSRLARTCKRKVGLTGTPMPHSPLDVYAQFRALAPDVFGWSFVRFRSRYAKMGGFGGKQVTGFQNMDHLQEQLAKWTYQADRSVLDLPDATHTTRLVELEGEAKRIYRSLDDDFTAAVLDGEVTAANALVKLLRLQQTTSGLLPVETASGRVQENVVSTAKQDALKDLFDDLDPREPVVVFGRFRGDLFNVHQAAQRAKRASLELSGARNELADWQAGHAPVLAVQIQSGGTGIDLTRARYCVYLSAGYSLGDYEQSLARVHRPGQKRPVSYYHFIAKDTVDEKVYDALRSRKQVVEAVLDGIHSNA